MKSHSLKGESEKDERSHRETPIRKERDETDAREQTVKVKGLRES